MRVHTIEQAIQMEITRTQRGRMQLYLCTSLFNHVQVALLLDNSSVQPCAWCSFAWPPCAGSFIFSISFVKNESLAKLPIVAARWCMSVAQAIADRLIIMDAAARKQAVVEIAWHNGVSLICIIMECAAVCLTVWLIHVCIINAGMSRGKDKSLVNVKPKNTGVGCKKLHTWYAQARTQAPRSWSEKHSVTYPMPLFWEVVLCLNQQKQ